MWFLVDHFSDNFNNFTLINFVIVDKSLNQQFKFSCFLFVDDRGKNVLDVEL